MVEFLFVVCSNEAKLYHSGFPLYSIINNNRKNYKLVSSRLGLLNNI